MPLTDENKIDLNDIWRSVQSSPLDTRPTCDISKYREHIKDLDLSEDEETELLENLWGIMSTFVDLGFGVDSVQLLSAPKTQVGARPNRDFD